MLHDKLSTRLALIIQKLNGGESFTIDELVVEFNVSKRTIQRDINERLIFLPLINDNGVYRLEEYALGKFNANDIKNFAILSGIKGLYPSLDNTFIIDLLNQKLNNPYLVKGNNYEDISSKKELFEHIMLCIVKKYKVAFVYSDKYRQVNPYKLVNNNNIWYLVGDEEGVLKTFTFSKIKSFKNLNECYKENRDFTETIENNRLNWFSQNSIEVTLEICNEVKEYFLRRDLFPNQTILNHSTKTFILKTDVTYDEEILKVVRYWIPHIKILSPQYLQQQLEESLQNYIKN